MPSLTFTTKGSAEALRVLDLANQRLRDQENIYKDNTRAARDLERAATRIFKNTKNPTEQFKKEMGGLLANFRSGKVNADQYAAGVKKLETAYSQANTMGGKLAGNISKMFSLENIARVGKYVTGIGLAATAYKLLANELRSALVLIDRASETKLSVGATRNIVIRNLAGVDRGTQRQVINENIGLAQRLGISERYINAGRAAALSASSGNIPASLAATDVAAQYLKDRPGEIGGFSGSLLDLSKVTGTSDANVNLGLLTQVASLSRVVDPRAQAQNIPRALVGASKFGSTAAGSAALFSAITTGSADLTGARSGNATINLTRQLNEFLTEDDTAKRLVKLQGDRETAAKKVITADERLAQARSTQAEEDTGKHRRVSDTVAARDGLPRGSSLERRSKAQLAVDRARADLDRQDASRGRAVSEAEKDLSESRKEQSTADTSLRSLEGNRKQRSALRERFAGMNNQQRIAMLQNNPALAQEFIQGASFEAATVGPIRELLTNAQSGIAKDFRGNLSKIPGNRQLAEQAQVTLGDFAAVNALETLNETSRRLEQVVETLRINTTDNLDQQGRANLTEILQHIGRSNLGAKTQTLLANLGDGELGISTAETINMLQKEAKRLRTPRDPRTEYVSGIASEAYTIPGFQPGEEELRQSALLQDAVDALKALKEVGETNGRKLDNIGVRGGP